MKRSQKNSLKALDILISRTNAFKSHFYDRKREILTDVLSGRSCFHGGKLQSEEFFATNY